MSFPTFAVPPRGEFLRDALGNPLPDESLLVLKHIDRLERENAALRKDKERLDFLQRVAEEGGFQCFGIEDSALLDFEFSNRENETSDLVRAAIDAARAKEDKL